MSSNAGAGWSVAVPIALGLLSAAVAVSSLSCQIKEQNELERKRVEATYLMKALDVVHTPSDLTEAGD